MAKKNKIDEEKLAEDFIKSYLQPEEELESTQDTQQTEFKDTKWHDLPLIALPLGKLYHPGYRFEFRAAELAEIQHFSTIDNDDVLDIRHKLNDILKSCLKVTLPNKKAGSYLDLKLGDRMYVIYTIREITFQKGKVLSIPVICQNEKCKHEFDIELVRAHIEMFDENEDIWNFYVPQYQGFVFNTTISDEPILINLPTIGIQESFRRWMEDKEYKNEKIDESFVKIAPYLINKNDLTVEELDEFKERMNNLTIEEFEFINDVVDRFKRKEFKVGIKGLVKKCPKCGQEVRTTAVFPERASDIFVVPNAFELYLKK